MKGKFDIRTGTRVLEEADSLINGKVKVLQNFAWGNYIQVDGLTQSGGVVLDVWKESLKKVADFKKNVQKTLLLGLCGGSAARVVRNLWQTTEIEGVELDPVMVDLGMKYLGLSGLNIRVISRDAMEYCRQQYGEKAKYDLLLVDVYIGDKIPQHLESEEFIKLVKNLLASDGVAVFNRLYYGEKRGSAILFLKKLEREFENIIPLYPESNAMFICKA